MKKSLIFLIILVVVLLGFTAARLWISHQNAAQNNNSISIPVPQPQPAQPEPESTPTPVLAPAPKPEPEIVVTSPVSNAMVKSPLVITGKARGTWYFEASFPVVLVDEKNAIIGSGVAQAKGDWMTEEFVPFEVTLKFTVPKGSKTGTLILKNDNPSGLPENEKSFSIPVKLAK